MKDIRIWALAILMGAVLGLAGGFAASFATSQGGGDGVGKVARSSEAGLLPSPFLSSGENPSSPGYRIGPGGSAEVRTSSKEPGPTGHFTSLSATGPDQGNVLLSSSTTASSTPRERSATTLVRSAPVSTVGQAVQSPASLSQNTTSVQWAREVLTRVQLVGDVNHDGVVDVQDLALVALAFGTALPEFDLNGDGIVDHEDLDVVARNLVR